MYEFKKILQRHIEENILKYFFVICLFAFSVVLGFLFSDSVALEVAENINGEIDVLLNGFSAGTIDKSAVFKTALIKNIRFLLLIIISGFSMWLVPLSLCTVMSLGFSVGFTVTYMASNFGGQGLAVALLSLVFTFLINIPVYMALAVASFNNSLRKRQLRKDGGTAGYVVFSVLCFGFTMISVVADSFVVPGLIKLFCG